MKYIRRICIIILCFFLLLCNTPKVMAYDNYSIDQVSVQWVIEENGFMRVYETYKVEYFQKTPNRNEVGFQIKLPYEKQISWNEGKQRQEVGITFVKVLSDQMYKVIESNSGYTIEFYNYGLVEEYQISYLVKLDPILYNNQTYIFYDMVGKRVNCYISDFDFSITLPKEINGNVKIHIPNYLGKDDQGMVPYTINGNTISGSYENMTSFANVEVLIEVDNDYLHEINYDFVNYITLSICFIIAFIAIMILKNSRKQEDVEVEVGNKIIQELNSMEVGYLYRGYSDARAVVSQLLYWAQKGYIQLEYINSKKTFMIRKRRDLQVNAKEYEKDLYAAIFTSGDDVRMKNLRSIFGREVRKVQKKMKRSFRTSSRKTVLSFFDKLLLSLLCSLPLIIICGTKIFVHTLSLSKLISFTTICYLTINVFVIVFLFINNKKKNNALLSLCLIVFGIIIGYEICVLYPQYLSWDVVLMTVTMSMMLIFVVCNIKLRSDYGDFVLTNIQGLKMFIEKVDKESFERDFKKNPKYIEELLPYAYTMKIEYEILDYIDELSWFTFEDDIDYDKALEVLHDHIFDNIMENKYIG